MYNTPSSPICQAEKYPVQVLTQMCTDELRWGGFDTDEHGWDTDILILYLCLIRVNHRSSVVCFQTNGGSAC